MSCGGNGTSLGIFEKAFGECLSTPRDIISLALGTISTLCWFCAQLPQAIENYKRGSALGLSPFFLLLAVSGDSANLIGCLLTGCLASQSYQALYFCCMDCLLSSQYMYYTFIAPKLCPSRSNQSTVAVDEDPSAEQQLVQNAAPDPETSHDTRKPLLSIFFLFTMGGFSALLFSKSAAVNEWSFSSSSSGRTLLVSDDVEAVGTSIGWISTALYIGCRVPQLIRNWQRKTTEGLAILMFMLAVTANVLYGSSIFVRSLELDFLLSKLPWLIGSLGTVAFDAAIVCQHFYYKKKNAERLERELPADEDL